MANLIKTDGNQNVLMLQLSVLVFQEGEYFVSLCPSLDLSSYGSSIQEAKDGFDEVMKAYIENGTRNKTLHKDLTSHGWVIINQHFAEPPNQVELNIPGGALKKQFNEKWSVPVC